MRLRVSLSLLLQVLSNTPYRKFSEPCLSTVILGNWKEGISETPIFPSSIEEKSYLASLMFSLPPVIGINLYNGSNRVNDPHSSRTDWHRCSFRRVIFSSYSEFWTVGEVKCSDSECYTLWPRTFRMYLSKYWALSFVHLHGQPVTRDGPVSN